MPVNRTFGSVGSAAARAVRLGAAVCLSLAMAGIGLALLLGTLALFVLALVVAGLLFPQELQKARAAWGRGVGLFSEWLDILCPRPMPSEEARKNAPEDENSAG